MAAGLSRAGAAVLALTAIAAFAPGAAEAARPLTHAEKRGIARTLEFLPARCLKGKRSTIDNRYAVVHGTNRGSCPQGNGLVAVKRIRGGWKELGQGPDDGTCRHFHRFLHLPIRVVRDLGICAPVARVKSCRPVENVFAGTRYAGSALYRIRARQVSCRTARRVARAGTYRAVGGVPGPRGRVFATYRAWTVEGDLRGDADRYRAWAGRSRVTWILGT